MKPKGVKKRPDEYDHAQGCPAMERERAEWVPMDDEHTGDPHCWAWGDWCITLINGEGYWLIVSSGVEYGPFATWDAVTQHAENVRAD
jgi:hypothetical protein